MEKRHLNQEVLYFSPVKSKVIGVILSMEGRTLRTLSEKRETTVWKDLCHKRLTHHTKGGSKVLGTSRRLCFFFRIKMVNHLLQGESFPLLKIKGGIPKYR